MMNLNALKIDPEFQGKIPPLNFEEEQQLEQNILHEGRLLNPIIIWNGFILDGHTRYRILRKHPFIVYQIQEIELANRYAALSWICQNQLGRRNLDPERKKFLMGKLYESEKLARGGSKERAHDENGRFTSMVQNDPSGRIQPGTTGSPAAHGASQDHHPVGTKRHWQCGRPPHEADPVHLQWCWPYPQPALQAVTGMIPVNRKFLRGDIYYANLEPHLGSEQGGIRPVVVVQNNTANCYSPNLIVAPVTSNIGQLDLNEWVWRREAYERYLRYHR